MTYFWTTLPPFLPHSIHINVLFKGWLTFLFAREGIRQMCLSTRQNRREERMVWPLLAFKQTNDRPITLIVQIWVIERKAWGKETKYHTPEVVFLTRCAANFFNSNKTTNFANFCQRMRERFLNYVIVWKCYSNMNLLTTGLRRRYTYT